MSKYIIHGLACYYGNFAATNKCLNKIRQSVNGLIINPLTYKSNLTHRSFPSYNLLVKSCEIISNIMCCFYLMSLQTLDE